VVGYVSYLKGSIDYILWKENFPHVFAWEKNPFPGDVERPPMETGELLGWLKLKRKSHEVQNTPSPCVC